MNTLCRTVLLKCSLYVLHISGLSPGFKVCKMQQECVDTDVSLPVNSPVALLCSFIYSKWQISSINHFPVAYKHNREAFPRCIANQRRY